MSHFYDYFLWENFFTLIPTGKIKTRVRAKVIVSVTVIPFSPSSFSDGVKMLFNENVALDARPLYLWRRPSQLATCFSHIPIICCSQLLGQRRIWSHIRHDFSRVPETAEQRLKKNENRITLIIFRYWVWFSFVVESDNMICFRLGKKLYRLQKRIYVKNFIKIYRKWVKLRDLEKLNYVRKANHYWEFFNYISR